MLYFPVSDERYGQIDNTCIIVFDGRVKGLVAGVASRFFFVLTCSIVTSVHHYETLSGKTVQSQLPEGISFKMP